MTHLTLTHFLVVGALLFSLGMVTVATRRNAVGVLMGVELILNAANVNLVAFNRYSDPSGGVSGQKWLWPNVREEFFSDLEKLHPAPLLDSLLLQDIRVVVDVTGLGPGTYQLTPKVEILVADVVVESILPNTLEVIILPNQRRPNVGRGFNGVATMGPADATISPVATFLRSTDLYPITRYMASGGSFSW